MSLKQSTSGSTSKLPRLIGRCRTQHGRAKGSGNPRAQNGRIRKCRLLQVPLPSRRESTNVRENKIVGKHVHLNANSTFTSQGNQAGTCHLLAGVSCRACLRSETRETERERAGKGLLAGELGYRHQRLKAAGVPEKSARAHFLQYTCAGNVGPLSEIRSCFVNHWRTKRAHQMLLVYLRVRALRHRPNLGGATCIPLAHCLRCFGQSLLLMAGTTVPAKGRCFAKFLVLRNCRLACIDCVVGSLAFLAIRGAPCLCVITTTPSSGILLTALVA